ncbi:hypothetical protein Rcae01_06178 [Novipirellula caenicola]|uniref:Uncharacterized protein n=1 Tax=Novipirellula caenicola TaxID=1536901 RepID=A0ABP9W419_9BACT
MRFTSRVWMFYHCRASLWLLETDFYSGFEYHLTQAYPATMGQSSPETLWQGDGPSSRCRVTKESESWPEIAFS